MIEPHGVSPAGVNVSSVTFRAVVSAESSTVKRLKLGGFSMFNVPRMPCTLPALPTLTASCPPPELRLVDTPVACTATVSAAAPVVKLTLLMSKYS